jgi:RHS repeat-associated protein
LLAIDYCGNIVYENGNLKYIPTPERYVTKSGNNYKHHYYVKDHLGNVRYYADGQVTNYYSFGLVNKELSTAQEAQPYKFGGKELDEMHRLPWYDFGARPYDPLCGSFTTMNPMEEKYYRYYMGRNKFVPVVSPISNKKNE